jgi:hypothetical protein
MYVALLAATPFLTGAAVYVLFRLTGRLGKP